MDRPESKRCRTVGSRISARNSSACPLLACPLLAAAWVAAWRPGLKLWTGWNSEDAEPLILAFPLGKTQNRWAAPFCWLLRVPVLCCACPLLCLVVSCACPLSCPLSGGQRIRGFLGLRHLTALTLASISCRIGDSAVEPQKDTIFNVNPYQGP